MAEPTKSPLSLRDVLNYEAEQHLSPEEVKWIQRTFKDNAMGVGVLRKLLVPTVNDPTLPIEEFANDAFNAKLDWTQIPADEAKIIAAARQDAMKFIFGGLVKLKIIAASEPEDSTAAEARRKKDDTR